MVEEPLDVVLGHERGHAQVLGETQGAKGEEVLTGWIHHEERDVARLTDEKLDAYCQLLKEQVAQLEMALFELPQHPRYQPLVGLEGPFGVVVQFDGPAKVRGLEFMIADLGDSVSRPQAGNAWPEVREINRARRTANRARR